MSVAREAGEPDRASFPIDRRDFFDPPAELTGLPPISPIRLPDGERDWVDGWLVTGHALARTMLADQRFSAVRSRARMATRTLSRRARSGSFAGSGPGMFIEVDDPEHARYRGLLTGLFTVLRTAALEPRIDRFVTSCLDDLAAAGQPADLVRHFAMAVPSLVICELLGVAYADRGELQDIGRTLLGMDTTPEQFAVTQQRFHALMRDLVAAKRAHPDDAMISGLIAADPTLTEEELANIALLLFLGGHETTANMLGLGTFALLRHPDQLAALRADPGRIPAAVEELLRYLSIVGNIGLPRTALRDVELGGVRVKQGQTVLVDLPVANRDPALTPDADVLDVTRPRTHHLAFGHGIHQCIGQQLARAEMRIGWQRLLARFPDLALAVEPEQVPVRADMTIYGVHALPVRW